MAELTPREHQRRRRKRHHHLAGLGWTSFPVLLLFLAVGGAWYVAKGFMCWSEHAYEHGTTVFGILPFGTYCDRGYWGGLVFAWMGTVLLGWALYLLWRLGIEGEAGGEAPVQIYRLAHRHIRNGYRSLEEGHHVHVIRTGRAFFHPWIFSAAVWAFVMEWTDFGPLSWGLLVGGMGLVEVAGRRILPKPNNDDDGQPPPEPSGDGPGGAELEKRLEAIQKQFGEFEERINALPENQGLPDQIEAIEAQLTAFRRSLLEVDLEAWRPVDDSDEMRAYWRIAGRAYEIISKIRAMNEKLARSTSRAPTRES